MTAEDQRIRDTYPDPKERQQVRINGEKTHLATRDDPELEQKITALANRDIREAAINSGIDLGTRHVGSKQALGPEQISRQQLLDQMLDQGVTPEQILARSKGPGPITFHDVSTLKPFDTFVDLNGEPRRIVQIDPDGTVHTADGDVRIFHGGVNARGELNSPRALLAQGGKFIPGPGEGFVNDEISTRVPSAEKAQGDPHAQPMFVDMDAMRSVPGVVDKLAQMIREYPGMRRVVAGLRDPNQVVEAFINHIADNLKWLHSQMPEDLRNWARMWYDTVHADTGRIARDYGVTHPQAAAVTAANSPLTEWNINRSRAERIIRIWQSQQDTVTTPEMIAKMKELDLNETKTSLTNDIRDLRKAGTKIDEDVVDQIRDLAKKGYRRAAYQLLNEETGANLETPEHTWKLITKQITGKTLGELPTEDQATWIRAFDEAHNDSSYDNWAPDGSSMGKVMVGAEGREEPAKLPWASFDPIEKSIEILKDGSRENISRQLGNEHKVRSFYNNIISPNSENPHVTIDTHAVSAGRISPFSGSSTEVSHNFGARGSSSISGSNGTYPLIAEAYKRAARDLGLLPRELQSIVWEQVRALFPQSFKGDETNVDAIKALWNKYGRGEMTLGQTRKAIVKYAGGFKEPEWADFLRSRSSGVPAAK